VLEAVPQLRHLTASESQHTTQAALERLLHWYRGEVERVGAAICVALQMQQVQVEDLSSNSSPLELLVYAALCY
jgi:hypothetical protein